MPLLKAFTATTRRPNRIRWAWLLPGPAALILFGIAQAHPAWTDRLYVRYIYPVFLHLMRWTSLVRFPLAPLLVALAAAALVLGLMGCAVSAAVQRSFRPLTRYLAALVCAAGLVYAWFMLFWGFQYQRTPIETRLDMTVDVREPKALRNLCLELIDQANALKRESDTPTVQDILDAVPEAFEAARPVWNLWPDVPTPAPKASGVNRLLSNLMIEGIYSPFTFEPLINTAIPPADLPFTACHEVAHSLGFAREEEANFIAYLVCSESPSPYFRYSGVMGALRYAMPALGEADPAAFWQCFDRISDPVRLDMAARDAYWLAMQQSTIALASQQINDGYLSLAMGQPEGARSYGRVVDLLLALSDP